MKVYCCEVDVNSGKVKRGSYEDPFATRNFASWEEAREGGCFDGGPGYATYDADGYKNVYAESVVSQDHADELVFNYCISLAHKLNVAAREIYGSKKGDAS